MFVHGSVLWKCNLKFLFLLCSSPVVSVGSWGHNWLLITTVNYAKVEVNKVKFPHWFHCSAPINSSQTAAPTLVSPGLNF